MIYTAKYRSGGNPVWDFDGNTEKPTFAPSLLCRYPWGPERKQVVCHSFIRKGQWQFLKDCTHELAGKTVPMVELTDD